MKNMKFRDVAIVLCTLALVLLPLAGLGLYVFQKYQWAEEKLQSLTPRYSRLIGFEAQGADMDSLLDTARGLVKQYAYSDEQDANQAGSAAQQKVRDIFNSAGLQVVSSQVLPAKTEKGFDRISLVFQVEGTQQAFQTALAVLPGQSPVIVLNELDLHMILPVPTAPGAPPRISVQFQFSAFRVHS